MYSFEGVNLDPPSDDPTTYCRLCLSKAEMRLLVSGSEPLGLVQLIWKQLDIQLTEPDDFPCAVCTICVQKLEELFECNDDGLLNEWEDDGLLEYRETCLAVNLAIKNWRSAAGTVRVDDKTIVLPFQQLGDGRYKCKECTELVFDEISACIRHHLEIHPSSSVTGLSTEGKHASDCSDPLISRRETHSATKRTSEKIKETITNGKHVINSNSAIKGSSSDKRPCFKCVNCSESFDNIDNLIQHRSDHKSIITKDTKQKRIDRNRGKRKRFMIDGNDTKCKECNVEFSDKKAFYFHLNAIHDLNICNICDESFSAVSVLIRHQAYHRNLNDIINPFLLGKHSFHCKVCFEKFRSEREIRVHYQIKHTESEIGSEGSETSRSTN
ncbi:zinc finger protein 780A-like [Ochlerotatus camptorhynchus]|uniref:zinc finger protein 780A-like n=1 Tax=Ochlerotatus camptorhynchus TaxID=644619 RepID=UPI0031DBC417